MRARYFLLLSLLLASLSGCAAFPRIDESLSADQYRERADVQIFKKDYLGAARSLEAAIRKDPTDGALYLKHGEILEILGRDRQARTTYRQALEAARPAPENEQIAWRLALLLALKLSDPAAAKQTLPHFAEGSLERTDLEGVLALQQGRLGEAIERFGEALKLAGEQYTARILYHAALAYNEMGEEEKTFISLFHAINQARNLADEKDIERFYNRLTEK